MPESSYIVAVLVIVFVITLALRAVPFAILRPLRSSKFVLRMATWMPVGILAILAISTLLTSAGADLHRLPQALVAVAVTTAVHLLAGRRTLLSVAAGTLAYVLLANFM